MHAQHPDIFAGMSLLAHIGRIDEMVKKTGARNILDYGIGKGKQYAVKVIGEKTAQEIWGVPVTGYDWAFEPFTDDSGLDQRYGGVIATDVLEHAEDCKAAVELVETLFAKAQDFVFASIACHEAHLMLPDGRNSRTVIMPPDWWAGVFDAVHWMHPHVAMWKLVCRDANGREVSYSNG